MPDRTPSDEQRQWHVVGEDRVIHDGWIRVSRRTYRMPDGRLAEWEMFGGGHAVGVLALTPEQSLVCVRQFRPGPDRVVLSLPGGLVDPGETPEQAAGRELTEETGYVSRDLVRVASLSTTSALGQRHIVIARDCVPDGVQHLDAYEDCEPVVLTVSEVRVALKAGQMTTSDLTYLGLDHAGLL